MIKNILLHIWEDNISIYIMNNKESEVNNVYNVEIVIGGGYVDAYSGKEINLRELVESEVRDFDEIILARDEFKLRSEPGDEFKVLVGEVDDIIKEIDKMITMMDIIK